MTLSNQSQRPTWGVPWQPCHRTPPGGGLTSLVYLRVWWHSYLEGQHTAQYHATSELVRTNFGTNPFPFMFWDTISQNEIPLWQQFSLSSIRYDTWKHILHNVSWPCDFVPAVDCWRCFMYLQTKICFHLCFPRRWPPRHEGYHTQIWTLPQQEIPMIPNVWLSRVFSPNTKQTAHTHTKYWQHMKQHNQKLQAIRNTQNLPQVNPKSYHWDPLWPSWFHVSQTRWRPSESVSFRSRRSGSQSTDWSSVWTSGYCNLTTEHELSALSVFFFCWFDESGSEWNTCLLVLSENWTSKQ